MASDPTNGRDKLEIEGLAITHSFLRFGNEIMSKVDYEINTTYKSSGLAFLKTFFTFVDKLDSRLSKGEFQRFYLCLSKW